MSIKLSDEAKAFCEKVYKCEPPCDSHGVCYDCIQEHNFLCGYELATKALLADAQRLADALRITFDRAIGDIYCGSTSCKFVKNPPKYGNHGACNCVSFFVNRPERVQDLLDALLMQNAALAEWNAKYAKEGQP